MNEGTFVCWWDLKGMERNMGELAGSFEDFDVYQVVFDPRAEDI
jgi:cytochrome oxidase Cu insertion factor (SCO1/SenC/PrrC family)